MIGPAVALFGDASGAASTTPMAIAASASGAARTFIASPINSSPGASRAGYRNGLSLARFAGKCHRLCSQRGVRRGRNPVCPGTRLPRAVRPRARGGEDGRHRRRRAGRGRPPRRFGRCSRICSTGPRSRTGRRSSSRSPSRRSRFSSSASLISAAIAAFVPADFLPRVLPTGRRSRFPSPPSRARLCPAASAARSRSPAGSCRAALRRRPR